MNERELAQDYATLLADMRRRWDADCPGVDDALRRFADVHGATIQAWIGEAPSRLVTWHDGVASYSLSLLLETGARDTVRLWPMAWRDDEAQLRRLVLRLTDEQLAAPVAGEAVLVRLETAARRLRLVRDAVVSGRAELMHDTKRLFDWTVQEVALPPRPPSPV